MKKIFLLCATALWLPAGLVSGEDPPPKPEAKTETVKATFLITGLHCPPCTRTVENSLRNTKGVKSVSVDWNTKNARVEFDEQLLPTQKLAQRITETPHMMGGGMRYGGWLALKAPDMKDADAAAWTKLKDSLAKVTGVTQVTLYKPQSGVGILFDAKGQATTQSVIAAASEAGFKLSNY